MNALRAALPLAIVAWGAFAAAASAQVSITAEALRGYYRPAKFIPLRVEADFKSGPLRESLELSADGAAGIGLDLHRGRGEAVVPWLILHQPGPVRWTWRKTAGEVAPPALRALADDERLVGIAAGGDVDRVARQMFPGSRIVAVELDRGRPLAGPAVAFESLDGLVLDAASAAALGEPAFQDLLACGVSVAAVAPQPPFARWRWQRREGYWLLRPLDAGPMLLPHREAVAMQTYQPVAGWRTDWPAHSRATIVSIATGFAVVAVLVSFVRRRAGPPLMFAAAAASVALGWAWWRFQSPVLQVGGDVVVIGERLVQTDTWTYQTSAGRAEATTRFRGLTRPVWASEGHWRMLQPRLLCRLDGSPEAWAYWVPAGGQVALLTRTVGPQPPLADPRQADNSPLQTLAARFYLGRGDRLAGQQPSTPVLREAYNEVNLWPAVVVDRR